MFEKERIQLISAEPIIYYDRFNNVYGFNVNDRLYDELFNKGNLNFDHKFVKEIKNKFNIGLLSPILIQDDLFNELLGISSGQILAIQFYIKSNNIKSHNENQISNFAQYLRKDWS